MLDAPICAPIDHHLSGGEFGDADYLAQNAQILYRALADVIRHHTGIAMPQDSTMPWPVRTRIRRELDFSFAELTEGKPLSNRSRLAKLATDGVPSAANSRVVRDFLLYAPDTHGSDEADIAAAFVRSMADEGGCLKAIASNDAHVDATKRALRILDEILPMTGSGCLGLAPSAVIVEGNITSGYINENPFSFFVNTRSFNDPVLLAETLLHESLHEKMTLIRLTSNLLLPGYNDLASEEAGDVLVPWPSRTQPRGWSFARAIAAYHVYVHTSAFYAEIVSRAALPELISAQEATSRLGLHFARADYLHKALQLEHCATYGDVDAKRFFAWTGGALGQIGDFIHTRKSLGQSEIAPWDPADVRRHPKP